MGLLGRDTAIPGVVETLRHGGRGDECARRLVAGYGCCVDGWIEILVVEEGVESVEF